MLKKGGMRLWIGTSTFNFVVLISTDNKVKNRKKKHDKRMSKKQNNCMAKPFYIWPDSSEL